MTPATDIERARTPVPQSPDNLFLGHPLPIKKPLLSQGRQEKERTGAVILHREGSSAVRLRIECLFPADETTKRNWKKDIIKYR
ncbi:hypothetical protein [Scytonema hofmannii]|uniref:hypothetical protein n=1 Tax=Scytonema hofmannii TaxID=34078 RepID=UPI0011DFBF8C|nr:hypothetical protein [Scytonema hofmannii]